MTQRKASAVIRSQKGAALLVFLLVIVFAILGALLNHLNSSNLVIQRDQITSDALAQAKDALIGYAITYHDTHPNQVFGYLPCPDANNDGDAESDCGAKDVSFILRLPWRKLGLPPLRDGSSECLWYAVSGHAKNGEPKTGTMNWDTLGQFVVQDADGSAQAGANAHERPWAVVFSPRNPVGTQSRTSAGASECGGSNTAADYLEMLDSHWTDPTYTGESTIKLANAGSISNGSNNDRALWITSKDIFDRVKKRADFKADIDGLLNDLAAYLNSLSPTSLPSVSGAKGIDTVIANYIEANPSLPETKKNLLNNWQDNLLYTGPSGGFTINGSGTTCRALLMFGGERTTRTSPPLVAQTRSTVTEKSDPGMYLEGINVAFPNTGNYTAATQYDKANPSADIILCINGLSAGTASFSNPTDFASFVPTGVGVTPDATTTPDTPTVIIADAAGGGGGCFWFATPMPLSGKTLRAYYQFKFLYPDPYALLPNPIPVGSPPDRGNGFTLQMVRSDIGTPTTCGTESNMGALATSDMWGSFSYIVETDVLRDGMPKDPAGNHTAIMTNGNLVHGKNSVSSACDGSHSGCLHSPTNKLEDTPKPLLHNQRIEIDTACNSTCTLCNQVNPVGPTYAKIAAWVDCADCSDVVTSLNRTTTPPTILRCTTLDPKMDSFYFGFTGGFRSGATAGAAPAQGVVISNFSLRSD